MPYDLELICEMCGELGLSAHTRADQSVEIDLGKGAVLRFVNAEREEDCAVGFLDTPWHTHGDLMFADRNGYYVELNYLDLLIGLKEGHVLICEQERNAQITDRWLTHSQHNDEFEYMQEGEEITVRRVTTRSLG